MFRDFVVQQRSSRGIVVVGVVVVAFDGLLESIELLPVVSNQEEVCRGIDNPLVLVERRGDAEEKRLLHRSDDEDAVVCRPDRCALQSGRAKGVLLREAGPTC